MVYDKNEEYFGFKMMNVKVFIFKIDSLDRCQSSGDRCQILYMKIDGC